MRTSPTPKCWPHFESSDVDYKGPPEGGHYRGYRSLVVDIGSVRLQADLTEANNMRAIVLVILALLLPAGPAWSQATERSEEHTSELQSQSNLVCRLLPEKKQQ